jgi:transcription initiation factor IIF auxiliary subunit
MVAEHKYKKAGLLFRTKAEKVQRDWYEWSVEVEGGEVPLTRVAEVEYILHPTFPNRIRRMTSRDRKFRLESEGWGEFDIAVNVSFENGDEKAVIIPLKFT